MVEHGASSQRGGQARRLEGRDAAVRARHDAADDRGCAGERDKQSMARKKIALIGAGNIGGELANQLVQKQLGDVVLFDIPQKEGLAKGKALDLEQASALSGADAKVSGTANWSDVSGADVLIITAGIPRKPGQSRDDLVASNLPIIRNV